LGSKKITGSLSSIAAISRPLASCGVLGDDGLETRDVSEDRFRALAVGLAAEDAAAERAPHGHRRDEFAGRAIAQPRRLADQLVQPGVDVIGELYFRHRPQAVRAHPHRDADNPAFADRGIEHARLAVLFLQAGGCAEHAAEIADVLAHHDHVGIALEHDVERVVDRLDHVHRPRGRIDQADGVVIDH
jgi:hypothetical protein